MSLPRYSGYKDSGVEWLGEVPEHWHLRRLGYFFEERREKVSDKEFQPLSVTKNGIVPQLETAAKTDDGENRKKVCKGDFVINSRSDRKGSSGLSVLDGSVSLISTVLRPGSEVHGAYVHHLLRSEAFQEEFYRYGKGIVADLWSTNYSEMRNITMAIPRDIDEQSAIATFLDRETAKIDALISEQEKLIALLAEKRQATISRAVTKGLNPGALMKDSGVEWLGEVPEHWAVSPLGYRYNVQLGKMLDNAKATGQHLRPYLRVFDVQWGAINVDNLPQMDFSEEDRRKFRLKSGDLLVNEGGSYPGRSAIWYGAEDNECYYQKALHRLRVIRPTEDTTEFAYFLMYWAANYGVFVAGGNETTIEHLPAEKLRRYRLPFPPIEEQFAIVRFLKSEIGRLELLSLEASRGITLLQERRSALISAAVTGKIDVRELFEQKPAKIQEAA
jgi:type I restriction enzyme S subunit